MPDPSTDHRAVLLGTPGASRLATAGWMPLADLEAKRKLNAYATALCAIVPPQGGGLVGWLWEQRIARITQAALILVHICQGNTAGLEPAAHRAAVNALWPELAA